MRYELNEPAVITEVLDGEAIILHMETGKYYSARDSALAIWQLAGAGLTRDELVARLQEAFPAAGDTVAAGVDDMLAQFREEELLRGRPAPVDAATVALDVRLEAFAPPVLERYTDMQELLLIDPIHEVEEKGWPHKRAG